MMLAREGSAEQRREDTNEPVEMRDDNVAWSRVKRRLRIEFGEDVYSSWFARLQFDERNENVAKLSVPTRFLKSWIESHYLDRVTILFSEEYGSALRLNLSIRSATPNREPSASEVTAKAGQPGSSSSVTSGSRVVPFPSTRDDDETSGNPLDPRLTFETYLTGRTNALAQAAAEKVSRNGTGPALYNPLFLHAGVGLGKTHLLQAIGNEARRAGQRVVYLTAERFMYGFVAALKAQSALAFKDRLRTLDLLIIDDVQFLQGKSISQEFGHTVNSLIDAGKQIVVAADRPPSELEAQDERVRSRLAGGLVVEVGALDEELRARILSARIAAVRSAHPTFQITEAVIAYVARVVATNGRDLDGAVNRLLAHSTLTGSALTIETAEVAIRDLVRNRDPKRVKIEDIQKLVASRYNVSRADILSERRTAAVVRPRQIAMYLAKSLTLRSLPEIGRRFGGRDHTTVLHAVRKIEASISNDLSLSEEIELLKRMLQE
jgi:chromosomal replication initiator protein